jgi:L-lactate dehydrogenase complex protein LldE
MRVGLCIPCFEDWFSPKISIATVKVLRRLNAEVDFQWTQTSCGRPALNTGYWDETRQLARRHP